MGENYTGFEHQEARITGGHLGSWLPHTSTALLLSEHLTTSRTVLVIEDIIEGLEDRKANVNGRGEPRILREPRGISKGFTEGTSELAPKVDQMKGMVVCCR